MKTSVIKVHDMLSVLSIEDVEKRIGEVPGVESATVNFDAGSATVLSNSVQYFPDWGWKQRPIVSTSVCHYSAF